jgi:hypothetical protein
LLPHAIAREIHRAHFPLQAECDYHHRMSYQFRQDDPDEEEDEEENGDRKENDDDDEDDGGYSE